VSVQITPLAIAPPLVRVTDWEFVRVADLGAIVRAGTRLIVVEVVIDESAALVAVIITVAAAEKTAGAVYVASFPTETSVPNTGLSDHFTVASAAPVTVADSAWL
jgi:hypothetical protein